MAAAEDKAVAGLQANSENGGSTGDNTGGNMAGVNLEVSTPLEPVNMQ